ncbi:hypothetical protein BGZ58_011292 [Dissophora ornata]|nr:hypothetical protein BGZ58_011292 [Dissophora ornata]
MGGITLVGTPAEPDCHTTTTTKLKNRQAEALNQLALDASALIGQSPTQFHHSQIQGNASFSISDFLVPGLQSKAWEDWQVADELNPFAMPANYNNYQDLALASFYGFTEQELSLSESDLGSDLSEVESLSDDDEDDEEEEDEEEEDDEPVPADQDAIIALVEDDDDVQLSAAVNMSLTTMESPEPSTVIENSPIVAQQQQQQQQPATADPNKRRMEEALVARINNDLGPEHMAGLFNILKSSSGQGDAEEDDDEEMEVDLSRLDETTLVELYQYVETCCMQTLGSILAAEEQERKRAAAAAKAEREALERARYYEQRTPELSPSHSSSSSSSHSPSPPHPSSVNSGCGSSNNKKRSATASTSCSNYYERNGVEEQIEALWMTAQHKSKRKRVNNNSPVCMGGGGTGKGRRIQKSFEEVQGNVQEEDMEFDEDDEIDVVGI